MNKIKFKDIEKVKKLYHKKGVYVITSEKYWDGGYDIDASLDEKCNSIPMPRSIVMC